jgi:hypothetical protein
MYNGKWNILVLLHKQQLNETYLKLAGGSSLLRELIFLIFMIPHSHYGLIVKMNPYHLYVVYVSNN